jgi:hypothetical protein
MPICAWDFRGAPGSFSVGHVRAFLALQLPRKEHILPILSDIVLERCEQWPVGLDFSIVGFRKVLWTGVGGDRDLRANGNLPLCKGDSDDIQSQLAAAQLPCMDVRILDVSSGLLDYRGRHWFKVES